jgi:hypothetical protein
VDPHDVSRRIYREYAIRFPMSHRPVFASIEASREK